MSDVAKLAGVSIGTVSNVLNSPAAVRASTREKVLDAISTLGFVPNSTARSLAVGRGTAFDGVLAVVGPDSERAVRAALTDDPLVSGRYRLV